MSVFNLPAWIKPHLFTDKKFSDLTPHELYDLRARTANFRHSSPDVSVVIPAWNEENNIFRAISSLVSNKTDLKVEIVVINNNSTDNTQYVLEELGVTNYFQPIQGIASARSMGLTQAKGRFHLCADSDTFYPPHWIDLMIKPMMRDKEIVGVYGRYSFIPPSGEERSMLWIYEKITGILIRIRKKKMEFINVLGFNMGFVTDVGRVNGGFEVTEARKFSNIAGTEGFVEESEDGRMALNLKKTGQLKLVTNSKARVFTSSRRLVAEGGIFKSFTNRLKLHTNRFSEYIIGK
ncbi:MAG: glycosyltransferase [Sphingobacteriales bacterium]|nr:glycosyltransferase [Sphingobacteriales bacterium]